MQYLPINLNENFNLNTEIERILVPGAELVYFCQICQKVKCFQFIELCED